MSRSAFLPATKKEMAERGWDYVDVVLVTGDAYVDHPSFGVALIGRWLEAHGFRVAILSQPRYHNPEDFKRFGRPRLFFGITAGNVDSIVSNYTGNAKVRDFDDYSPQGNPYFGDEKSRASRRRPDRACISYSIFARAAYKNIPVVLGGLEASLRRFVHYDYQQEKLRTSILTDSKADLLVYGMGERASLEIAKRLERGKELRGIAGTCERISDKEIKERIFQKPALELPSWQDIENDIRKFMDAELHVDKHARALSHTPILQHQQAMWVIQNKPAEPLKASELDDIYSLPFIRAPHPQAGDVPAYRMIRHSVTIVRGCSGNCSFCAIARHQGPVIISRSHESVLKEVKEITMMPDFKGTISDLGGPTANLYGTSCANSSSCTKHDCLYPRVCNYLRVDENAFAVLLEKVSRIKGLKHVFVSSGLHMELLLRTPRLLEKLLNKHIPGVMKIAPEHTEAEVLRLMHKQSGEILSRFLKICKEIALRHGKKIYFSPYFISAHPGSTLNDMKALAEKIKRMGLSVRFFQDFTPTPGTLSTAMYITGLHRDNLKPIYVPHRAGERREQRMMLEKMMRK
ncbi:MAG: YgiQ family radical SAM protein [Candidatus Schekmanbacteria bacterium RBG_16_38_10]|uniref:YgiQ family radical SAM protein n=1 Tax=Candidatus Schekmanbacteria bacterium RBG_16_38_10 TaxID=1817879 RepID=A0A1F7RZZ8_9BACT|nr:MAG: YgiQ family radical SAM protein [Candidatus Schekmanbacteria bacterium RBG_16_38_10]